MLDLRDSENSNWIKNVGQQDEGEDIEKSSYLLTLEEWLDKQSHNDLRSMNPPSRPPHKGAVWNPSTHRWSKGGEKDLDKQDGVSSAAEAKRRGLVPQSGNWDKPVRWVKPEELDEESDKDKEKKAEELTQPKGAIAQKLKKFNDKLEKFFKTLDDLIGGRVDNPQQTFDDLENIKGEVDQEIDEANTKIDENEGKVNDLHESGKIDDDTKEKADKELELLRKHYEEQKAELDGKWDENYEKLKEKLSLEESEGEDEEEDEDEDDDYEDDDEEVDVQWESYAKNSAEHDSATSSGWGGEEHDEEDFNSETGELEVPGKNANDVRGWAKELEEKYDVELIGGPTGNEPHDDIYEHFGLTNHMGAEKIGSQLIADYVKEKTGEEVSFPGGESKEAEPKTLNEYVEREKRMDSQVIEDGGSVEDEKEESSGESTESNAKTLLDKTTQETDELKNTRKEIERQQKILESKLEDVGDEESKKEITDQIANSKNKVDSINTKIKTQARKSSMANVLLNKKPSLNGAEQDS